MKTTGTIGVQKELTGSLRRGNPRLCRLGLRTCLLRLSVQSIEEEQRVVAQILKTSTAQRFTHPNRVSRAVLKMFPIQDACSFLASVICI